MKCGLIPPPPYFGGVPVYLSTVLFIFRLHLILLADGMKRCTILQFHLQRKLSGLNLLGWGKQINCELSPFCFFFFFSQSQPPTHCIQPQLSPLLLLPPSLSIDAGSHTCHLSLLIMHGRCCWCGLSHWDWEQQEWQHYAAEQSTAPASVTQQLFFRGVLHLQWWVYGRPWQQLWDGFTRQPLFHCLEVVFT